MKILQLVQKPQRRGAEVFAFHLAKELRRRNQQVQVAYLYPYNGQNGLPIEASDVLLNGNEKSFLEVFPGIHTRLFRRLQILITDFQPDIVQANGARTVKYGAFARHFSRNGTWALIYRNIGNPQDWISGRAKQYFYQRFIMTKIDGVVGVSQTTLQRVLDFYHLAVASIHIPRGIDIAHFKPSVTRETMRERTQTPIQSKIVLFVGSLTQEKRLDRFLRVIGSLRLNRADVHAWVAGDGPLRASLEKLAQEMELQDIVHFLGVQPDIASLINASDLLMLTSDTEGIPGVVLEAGSLGVPSVATSVGGLHECVVDNQTGILVDREDEERMARVASELLNDPIRYRQMAEQAKRFVTENFDIGEIASKYLGFYTDVLRLSRNRRVSKVELSS